MMTNSLWLMAVAGGPIVLAAVIIYVRMRARRFGPAEKAAQDRATRELYENE
jgi:hypothetical protein